MSLLPQDEERAEERREIGFEDRCFCCLGSLLLAAWLTARGLGGHFQSQNPRVQYGMDHLPNALLAAFLFAALMWVGRRVLVKRTWVRDLSTWYFVGVVVAGFCLFWLPAVLAGGFDRDDWMLLGAASVRKMLAGHPWLAWKTLDTVDGNFRPLGTVLYMGVMLRHFGVWARPFLLGLFAVNLLACLVAFALVRSLGYSRMAAAAAAMLYLSRSQIYSIVTWTCALGDALVILLCGLMALFLLGAVRRKGWRAGALHLAAWGCFCVATLAKQSAFAAPVIVGLLLLLRPGTAGPAPSWGRRWWSALVSVAVYGATAAVPFFHAKRLLASQSPYPIGFSFDAFLRVFGYAVWYLGTFEFPTRYERLQIVPSMAGLAVLCAAGVVLWRVPKLLGERPRDVVFCLLAAGASVSLFVVLPARVAPYYGSMAAFWMSLALGIGLTRFGWAERENLAARRACFLFCALVVTGFADVRIKQTGLFPAGGYTWGASEVGMERAAYATIARELAASPGTETLVLADTPDYDGFFAGMAMAADPGLKRIFTYRSSSGSFLANDRRGLVPVDDMAGLRSPKAYNWNVPLDRAEAERLLGDGKVLWLKFHEGKIESGN